MQLPATTRPRRRWVSAALALVLALAPACTAASRAATDGPSDPGPPAFATGAGEGSSASARAHLAQLLTAEPAAASTARGAEVRAGTTAPSPSGPPYTTGPRAGSPVITPPPALPPGDGTVYAVGDSVLLGTKDYLPTTLGGWDLRLDGRVGRRFREGLDIFRENRQSLGQVAVVILGHNDGDGRRAPGYLDELMVELRGVQRVVVVTLAEWSPSQPLFNRAIRDLPGRYGNVVVADWAAVSAANPQFLIGDRVHLTRAGAIALSNLIAVMVGPAPAREGRVPPPPRILPIPDAPDPAPIGQPIPTLTTTTTSGESTTTSPASTTSSSTTSTPSLPASSTSTTVATTTSVAPTSAPL